MTYQNRPHCTVLPEQLRVDCTPVERDALVSLGVKGQDLESVLRSRGLGFDGRPSEVARDGGFDADG